MQQDINRKIYHDLIGPIIPVKQMIFVSGPRQAGKTTFINQVASNFDHRTYVNWEVAADRRKIIADPDFFQNIERVGSSRPAVVFDEIHKKTKWKNYLKSCYDRFGSEYKFFCAGSGRLDLFQKGSDSLAGRYFLFHVWPFTVAELAGLQKEFEDFFKDPLAPCSVSDLEKTQKIWQRLLDKSGFPDPYLSVAPSFQALWQQNYQNQLLREDVPSLTRIEKIDQLEALMYFLPSKVGNPLSINNLAKDLGVAFETVKNWLSVFERMFLVFRISPWSAKLPRAVTKEQKLYLFDYTLIEDEGSRFENMVAMELWRAVHSWNERGLGKFKLCFARNRDEKEVDFLICNKNKPWLLIETKLSDESATKSARLIQSALKVPLVQLIQSDGVWKETRLADQRVLVCTASKWLASLP